MATGRAKWETLSTEEIVAYLEKYRSMKHGSSRRTKKMLFLETVINRRIKAYNLLLTSQG